MAANARPQVKGRINQRREDLVLTGNANPNHPRAVYVFPEVQAPGMSRIGRATSVHDRKARDNGDLYALFTELAALVLVFADAKLGTNRDTRGAA